MKLRYTGSLTVKYIRKLIYRSGSATLRSCADAIFKHVASKHNSADLLTRAISFREFSSKFDLWFTGPEWMTKPLPENEIFIVSVQCLENNSNESNGDNVSVISKQSDISLASTVL